MAKKWIVLIIAVFAVAGCGSQQTKSDQPTGLGPVDNTGCVMDTHSGQYLCGGGADSYCTYGNYDGADQAGCDSRDDGY